MNATRILWTIAAVALLGFAIFEGVKYGWIATIVLVVFAIVPDLALIGAFAEQGRLKPHRVRAYNVMHSPWIPIALMLVSLLPIPALGWGLRGGLELFLAGLAWLLHIAIDRAVGYGRCAPDGSVIPVGRARMAA